MGVRRRQSPECEYHLDTNLAPYFFPKDVSAALASASSALRAATSTRYSPRRTLAFPDFRAFRPQSLDGLLPRTKYSPPSQAYLSSTMCGRFVLLPLVSSLRYSLDPNRFGRRSAPAELRFNRMQSHDEGTDIRVGQSVAASSPCQPARREYPARPPGWTGSRRQTTPNSGRPRG